MIFVLRWFSVTGQFFFLTPFGSNWSVLILPNASTNKKWGITYHGFSRVLCNSTLLRPFHAKQISAALLNSYGNPRLWQLILWSIYYFCNKKLLLSNQIVYLGNFRCATHAFPNKSATSNVQNDSKKIGKRSLCKITWTKWTWTIWTWKKITWPIMAQKILSGAKYTFSLKNESV